MGPRRAQPAVAVVHQVWRATPPLDRLQRPTGFVDLFSTARVNSDSALTRTNLGSAGCDGLDLDRKRRFMSQICGLYLVMPQAMSPLEQVQSFKLDLSPSTWFDLWHTHVDWNGEGNASIESRKEYLSALFSMFEKALSQTREWEKPSNVWLLVVPENAEDDSLYVHTENPNKNTDFPYSFEGVVWDIDAPQLLQPFLKSNYEVGVSEYNGTMYWVRERAA
jgi:hypothetical protein